MLWALGIINATAFMLATAVTYCHYSAGEVTGVTLVVSFGAGANLAMAYVIGVMALDRGRK